MKKTKMRMKTVDFKKKQSRATSVLTNPPGDSGWCSVLLFGDGKILGDVVSVF